MNFSVTFLDALIVLIIIVSAGYAAWRGFLWETLTVFAWVAAAIACLWLGPSVYLITKGMISQEWLGRLVAYAITFLAVFIPLAFISHRFSESVKHSPIGPLDRAAGVAFGVVRGLVIIGLGYLAFTYFVAIKSQPAWVTQARLLPLVQATAEEILIVVPSHPGEDVFARHQPAPVIEQQGRHDPMADLIRSNGKAEPAQAPAPAPRHDSMADLIRRNGSANSVKTTREPAAANSTTKPAKSAGTSDRQRLNDLIETGGNGNR